MYSIYLMTTRLLPHIKASALTGECKPKISYLDLEDNFLNASRRVVVEPNRDTRLMLLGLMNVYIDAVPISTILKIAPGNPVDKFSTLQLVRLSRHHERLEETKLFVGYDALAGFLPEVGSEAFEDPAVVSLRPDYDSVVKFRVDYDTALYERLGNGG